MVKTQNHCIRCGECCIRSSPTLHVGDLHLIAEGAIARQDLYTIRNGELVWDNIMGALIVTREEMIKIREKEEGSCLYYNDADKACEIYEKRPAQCSAMACWDSERFMKVFREPKLTRKDIIKDPVLAALMGTHETKCGYAAMERHVRHIELEGDKAVAAIIQILRFDNRLRPYLSQNLNVDPKEMDFIFGRSMIDTVVMFGLKVERESDGSFYLTALPRKTGSKI